MCVFWYAYEHASMPYSHDARARARIHTLTHTLSLTHTHNHSHTHTYTHTHTHTHTTHTQEYSPVYAPPPARTFPVLRVLLCHTDTTRHGTLHDAIYFSMHPFHKPSPQKNPHHFSSSRIPITQRTRLITMLILTSLDLKNLIIKTILITHRTTLIALILNSQLFTYVYLHVHVCVSQPSPL